MPNHPPRLQHVDGNACNACNEGNACNTHVTRLQHVDGAEEVDHLGRQRLQHGLALLLLKHLTVLAVDRVAFLLLLVLDLRETRNGGAGIDRGINTALLQSGASVTMATAVVPYRPWALAAGSPHLVPLARGIGISVGVAEGEHDPREELEWLHLDIELEAEAHQRLDDQVAVLRTVKEA